MEREKFQEFSPSSASNSRPQPERTFLGAARTCDLTAFVEVHARQLCTVFKHLDVACRVAVASTNGERSMRSRGREVEKRVGSALSVTPKNGKFHRKSGLAATWGKNVPRSSTHL